MIRVLIAFIGLSLSAQILPPRTTPGVINPDIIQANITTTVCAANWTDTVRPPASYTTKLKIEQMIGLKLRGKPADLEEDHRVPLEVGGNPRDPRNLWPEPWARPYGAHEKDRLENAVKRDLCAGRLTLAQARAIFLGDFWAEYKRRFEQKTNLSAK